MAVTQRILLAFFGALVTHVASTPRQSFTSLLLSSPCPADRQPQGHRPLTCPCAHPTFQTLQINSKPSRATCPHLASRSPLLPFETLQTNTNQCEPQGHYAPAVANRVYRAKELGEGEPVNIKGVAIGNGLTMPALQFGA